MSAAGVGVLIALGAMFGKLLFDSGGADEIVDTIVGRSSASVLPWTMAAVGGLIGLPMFFEIGGQQLDQGHSRLHRYAPGRVVDRSPRRDVHPRPGSRDGQGGAHQDDRAVAPADSPASS
jgi:GntP family permease